MKSHIKALSGHDLNMSPSFPGILSVYAAFPAPPPAVLPLLHQLTSLHDIWRYFFASHLLKMLEVYISVRDKILHTLTLPSASPSSPWRSGPWSRKGYLGRLGTPALSWRKNESVGYWWSCIASRRGNRLEVVTVLMVDKRCWSLKTTRTAILPYTGAPVIPHTM